MTRREWIGMASVGVIAAALGVPYALSQLTPDRRARPAPGAKSDAQWRALLSPAAYRVLRQGATEKPYSSPLLKEQRAGTFVCAGCDRRLFDSHTKYDSRTGWPSFWDVIPGAVSKLEDRSLGMSRTEVRCAQCDGHLGHVFDDGPQPTGLRYCMNGVALAFAPAAA